jgi:hypothetical protein
MGWPRSGRVPIGSGKRSGAQRAAGSRNDPAKGLNEPILRDQRKWARDRALTGVAAVRMVRTPERARPGQFGRNRSPV